MERGNVIAFIETGTEKELEGIQIVVTILHYLSICPQMDYLSILLYFTLLSIRFLLLRKMMQQMAISKT